MERCMERCSVKVRPSLYHIKDGMRIEGEHNNIKGYMYAIVGDCSNIFGDISSIVGDVTNINGNVSGIHGDVTNIKGDVTGIRGDVNISMTGDATDIKGNLDECKITARERAYRVHIEELIKQ